MSYLDKKLVFVGGATGLAGVHILKHLASTYPTCRIRACIHVRKQPLVEVENVEYLRGDLKKQDDCREMLDGCDCAIMAAAETGGSAALKSEPWKQVNDNLIMNAQFLESCIAENIKRIVCVISATLYQELEGAMKEEDLDLNKDPHPAYFGVGWVNRSIEKLCTFWYRERGLEAVIARTSNIFGPYASFNPARSNFIPAIIRKSIDRMEPFEVWGSPDVTRDVIYSTDFASAIIELMNHDEIKYDVFNVGSGEKTTVKSVVEWALKYAGHSPKKIVYDNKSPSSIKYRSLDCSKIKRLTGWKPLTSIEEGIRETVEWWKNNKESWDR